MHGVDDNIALKAQVQQLIDRPFDLSNDYMFRADLISVSRNEYLLVVTMHHIASDGWSLSIVVKEVVDLYKSNIEKTAPDLPALPIQYADYAIWQRSLSQNEILNKKISYWKEKLQEISPLEMPTDYVRPAVQTTLGDIETFTIEKGLLKQIQALSQQQGVTLFMTLVAACKVLLYRYTNQQDIAVGTPTANRNYKEVEDLVGLFLNTVALRSNVNGKDTFGTLLQQVKTNTLDAFEHQDVPFEKVVEAVVKQRDISRNAIFQVMFTLQNTPEIPKIQLGEAELSSEGFAVNTSKFDLSFSLTEYSKGLHGSIIFNTGLFKRSTIQRMWAHYKQLLLSIVQTPQQKVALLQMLPESETDQLLHKFNVAKKQIDVTKTLTGLFLKQALASPGNIALIHGDLQVTYTQLNERSNQLAHYLKIRGVRQEEIVPICIDRSIEMMVGILAILKAGAAYVPA